MKKFFTIMFLCCITLFAHYSFAQELTGLNFSKSADQLKVVFELSQRAKFKSFTLDNPPRVVLDIDKGSLAMPLPDATQVYNQSQGLAKSVRSGQYNKSTYRVVIELAELMRTAATSLPPSQRSSMHRVVLDMKMLNAPTPGALTFNTRAVNNRQGVSQVKENIRSTFDRVELKNTNTTASFADARKLVIAIDAGHGGKDPGALGQRKTKEKDVVLQIAQKLANKINQDPRMKAVLTRKGDYFVGLHTRTKIAREAGADLFVSIHADAVARGSAKGSSVYVLSNKRASSEFAKSLANRENNSFADGALVGKEMDVKKVLLDLSKDRVLHDSLLMSTDVLNNLKKIGPVHSNKTGRAGFAVLKSLDIPSILVETAFISNLQEEKKLNTINFQNQLADAVYNGLVTFANRGSFEQVAQFSQ